MITLDIFRALKAGEELANSVKVKNVQAASNALAALLVVGASIGRAYGYNLPLADDQLVAIAGAVCILVFNAWATLATSGRVGIGVQPPASGDDAGTPDPAAERPVPGGWGKDMGVGG